MGSKEVQTYAGDMDFRISENSLPPTWDFDKNDSFIYSRTDSCRVYHSGLRIYDDGRECRPDGTTQFPPEGCRIRYYATEEDVPYTKSALENELGQGAYGKVDVVEATHGQKSQDSRKFARKEFHHRGTFDSSSKSAAQQNLEREIDIYNKLEKEQPTQHRVKIVDAYTVGMKRFFLIMHPVAEGRTLQNKLYDFAFDRENRTADEIAMLRRAIGCLTVAIARLHDKGFRHRDLHPGNILLHGGEILVCDFGASLHTQYKQRSTTSTDFPPKMERYAAPEVISSLGKRNKMADVFSLGAILFEIVFAIWGREELDESFRDGGYRYEARIDEVEKMCDPSSGGSGMLWDIAQMLQRNQQNRPLAKTVASRILNRLESDKDPLMCSDCEGWLRESGEPQKLRDEVQEIMERVRKQTELQERREKRQALKNLSVKRTRSFGN
ncbi:kinase-like protein [Dothidotthia symphoricarpi CBS 119687]|uniref:Kinase-like protein n=1 Tax=Dothidotthia symphoricarpi CBS 119687 TaxID=1392245 RepID=A0A6A6ASF3_9PLEO|nr:kinase-like protein [Dothidotthia symphoricarpi CBS 119687]KAF2133874.1 kinase-like protein [Dothidotthia symphoricarpi CBS 119687]